MFKKILISILCFSCVSMAAKRLDCWADIMLSLGASKDASLNITPDLGDRAFSLDYTEKQTGSFSVVYDSSASKGFTAIGFVSGQFASQWDISENTILYMNVKIAAAQRPAELIAELVDAGGRVLALSSPLKSGEDWQLLAFTVKGGGGFDLAAVTACRFSQPFIADARIWFDDVYFVGASAGGQIGITEKTLEQRFSEAVATRAKRTDEALKNYRTEGLREGFNEILCKMIAGKELDQINKRLYEILTSKDEDVRYKYRLSDHWCLVVNQTLYRMYCMYGSKGTVAAGRLSADAEKALLAELWDRTVEKNDITIARKSTWWMIGSENHDVVGKVSCLIASQIFKDVPEYSDRILPDRGHGGGTGYWFHQMYADDKWQGPEGLANWSDGKSYNSGDHYKAWTAFWKEYITERLHKGFFLETFSPGYMGVTISHIYDIYDLCEDKELKELTGRLLDAIWADWAQDSISGVKGGSKARIATGLRNIDSMYTLSQFEFGGKLLDTGANMWVSLVTDYRFPKVVWDIAIDREGLGCFEYLSRRPGEEENVWPRPAGTERTLVCDTESRYLRYSWVTPDYVLGCRMDHPASVHSHLSIAKLWQGMTFAATDNARIFPCQVVIDANGKWKPDSVIYFTNFQKNGVMISQQCRKWTQVSPQWYPSPDMYSQDAGMYFGDNLDRIEEKGGWIFAAKNNGFAAVRVVLSDMDTEFKVNAQVKRGGPYSDFADECYIWNNERTMIKFVDKYSPVIIHSGRRSDYKSFEAFKEYILAGELNIVKTVVSGWFIVEYKPLNAAGGKDTYYYNAATAEIPSFNGELVDYAPQFLFKSPYIFSKYKSGAFEVKKGNNFLAIQD